MTIFQMINIYKGIIEGLITTWRGGNNSLSQIKILCGI